MAGNRIQIRRGNGAPSGGLLGYELGWDYTNKILYINSVENNAGILRKIGGEGAFLPLTGGTLSGPLTINGNLKVGNAHATSSSSHALWGTGITVSDTRYDAIGVTSLSKAANFFFSNNGTPNTNWWAGIHVAGWTGDYNAWELVGPAHNTDQRTTGFYVRVGRTSTGWGSWRALVTSSDTTSRRIFVTTSASVPSGAVAGDIVLVKA